MKDTLKNLASKLGFESWDKAVHYINGAGHKEDGMYTASDILNDLRIVVMELDREGNSQ